MFHTSGTVQVARPRRLRHLTAEDAGGSRMYRPCSCRRENRTAARTRGGSSALRASFGTSGWSMRHSTCTSNRPTQFAMNVPLGRIRRTHPASARSRRFRSGFAVDHQGAHARRYRLVETRREWRTLTPYRRTPSALAVPGRPGPAGAKSGAFPCGSALSGACAARADCVGGSLARTSTRDAGATRRERS